MLEVLCEGGKVGHRLAVTGKRRNSSFFSDDGSSDSFSDKLLSCLKNIIYYNVERLKISNLIHKTFSNPTK